MSTDRNTPARHCPSQLDLSTYTDREGAEHVAPHLQECPSCKTVVAFYGYINTFVRKTINPDDSLVERIKCACRREREATARRHRLQLLFWRAAAALAIIVAVTAVYVASRNAMTANRPGTEPPLATNNEMTTPRTVPTIAAHTLENGATEPAPSATTLAPNDIANVGTAADAFGSAPNVHVTPNRVRHVWVVKDLEDSARLFCSLIPAQAKWKQGGNAAECASFLVALSDKDLQALVDGLAGAGFSLVSPTFPQPGEKRKLLASGRTVLYDVDLVPAP